MFFIFPSHGWTSEKGTVTFRSYCVAVSCSHFANARSHLQSLCKHSQSLAVTLHWLRGLLVTSSNLICTLKIHSGPWTKDENKKLKECFIFFLKILSIDYVALK